MKTAILIANGVKQIMFTAENNAEKEALKYISPDDDIHTVVKRGSFYDGDEIFGVNIYECRGGYMRAEQSKESVMFILTPKNPSSPKAEGK
jgi:hypothetical protein